MPNKVKNKKKMVQMVVYQPKAVPARRSSKKSRAGKTKRRRVSMPAMSLEAQKYASLLLDPCNGPLVRAVGSVHPGAVTERIRLTSASFLDGLAPVASLANGYIVWFPTFHNTGSIDGGVSGVYSPANCFYYHSALSSTVPINTAALPGGVASGIAGNGASNTGVFLRDPGTANLTSASPFVRATTLSACLQMDYTGALSAISGQVAVVQNFSLASFITNINTGAIPAFPSVDAIFAHAADRERLHPEGAEVIWRPTDQSVIPRTTAAAQSGSAQTDLVTDAAFWSGSPGVDHTRVCATNPGEIFGICIAWKGVPVNSLSFNAVKVVDFELAPRNNQIEEIRSMESPALASTTIDSITNMLDGLSMGWQSSLRKMSYDAARAAMPGVGSAILDTVSPLLANVYSGGHPYHARAALRGIRDL